MQVTIHCNICMSGSNPLKIYLLMNCDSAINNSDKNNSFCKTKESAKHVSLSITYRTFSSYIYTLQFCAFTKKQQP